MGKFHFEMSTRKSSMIAGALAEKSIDWTKVPDEELATNINNTDSAEEAEKCWKEEEARHQREAEAEQKWEAEKVKRAAAAGARKQQQADSEAQVSGSWATGVKKRSACGSCMKAKEWCEWPKVEMTASRARMSPRGGEHKKWAKKVANKDDEDESNRRKMQQHYMLMEGLVGQQQMLLFKLVKMASDAGSGRAKEVVKGQEEPQEPQGEGSGGQEETEGVPGGVPGNELGNALGNELENGTGAEDGTEEEAQKDKGKGKEKDL
ncbi:hypothetical protein ID866_12011 [Astraeus odoratus]|nr:hypothetical protein ID866_12011 [Astraeus odoratus]